MPEAPRNAPAGAPVEPELRRAVELVRASNAAELKQELQAKTGEQLSKLLDVIATERVSAEVREVLRQAGIEKGLSDLEARLGKLQILAVQGEQGNRRAGEQPGFVEKLAAMTTVGLMGVKMKGGDAWYSKAAGSVLSFLSSGAEDPVTATRAIARNLRKGFYMVLSSPGFLGLDKIPLLGRFFEGTRDKYNQLRVVEELEAIAKEEKVNFDDRIDMGSWKKLAAAAKKDSQEPLELAANVATTYVKTVRDRGDTVITLSLREIVPYLDPEAAKKQEEQTKRDAEAAKASEAAKIVGTEVEFTDITAPEMKRIGTKIVARLPRTSAVSLENVSVLAQRMQNDDRIAVVRKGQDVLKNLTPEEVAKPRAQLMIKDNVVTLQFNDRVEIGSLAGLDTRGKVVPSEWVFEAGSWKQV